MNIVEIKIPVTLNAFGADSKSGVLRRPSWLLIWSFTCVVFLVGVLTAESVWRNLGYRPSAIESPALWKFWYDRAVGGGPRSIAIIGTSRIQAGISTTVMRHRLSDYRIVQIAKFASGSPIGILRALASEDFNGIVICDTIEPFLMRTFWEDQHDSFEYTGGTLDRLEAVASASFRDCLAIRNTHTGIRAALIRLVTQSALPLPDYVRRHADRSLEFDSSGLTNLEALRQEDLARYRSRYEQANLPSAEELRPDIEEIEGFVRSIQARGGQVVFLRMPSSRERLALEEEYHPKNIYWDHFAATSSGIWIHPTELDDSRGWECPDDSHLDYRDAIRFTNALVNELLRRRVVSDSFR